MSEFVEKKSDRLVAEAMIAEVEGARVFAARGSHGATYSVVVFPTGAFACSCKASQLCSHVLAARKLAGMETRA